MASHRKQLEAVNTLLSPTETIIADVPSIFIESKSSSTNPVGLLALTAANVAFATGPGRRAVGHVHPRSEITSIDFSDGLLNSYIVINMRSGALEYRVNPREAKRFMAAVEGKAPDGSGPGASGSIATELEKLADLHTRGLLNDEEFAAAKAKLLS
jgi:hypothetical protein